MLQCRLNVNELRVPLPVAGIDGKKNFASVAWVGYGRRLTAIKVDTVDVLLCSTFALLADAGVERVVYESPYSHLNVKTYGTLYHAMRDVEKAAKWCGVEFDTVTPLGWQAAMLLLPGEGARALKGNVSKKRSCAVASAWAGGDITDDDTADAICIMLHANMEEAGEAFYTFAELNETEDED